MRWETCAHWQQRLLGCDVVSIDILDFVADGSLGHAAMCMHLVCVLQVLLQHHTASKLWSVTTRKSARGRVFVTRMRAIQAGNHCMMLQFCCSASSAFRQRGEIIWAKYATAQCSVHISRH